VERQHKLPLLPLQCLLMMPRLQPRVRLMKLPALHVQASRLMRLLLLLHWKAAHRL
jgi:hypothetical protein